MHHVVTASGEPLQERHRVTQMYRVVVRVFKTDLSVTHPWLDQEKAGIRIGAHLNVPDKAPHQSGACLPRRLELPVPTRTAGHLDERADGVVWTAPVRADEHEDTAGGEHAIKFGEHRVDVQDVLEHIP